MKIKAKQIRAFAVDTVDSSSDSAYITMSLSSETPYLRSFGINTYRADHSSFGGCSFVEVDNLPTVLPKGIDIVEHDFEDKRLIFEPTNPGK